MLLALLILQGLMSEQVILKLFVRILAVYNDVNIVPKLQFLIHLFDSCPECHSKFCHLTVHVYIWPMQGQLSMYHSPINTIAYVECPTLNPWFYRAVNEEMHAYLKWVYFREGELF